MIYCSKKYEEIQNYKNFIRIEGEQGEFCFIIEDQLAISLPKSPIGGIQYDGFKESDFITEWTSVELQLQDLGVNKIELTIAPNFYDFSIPTNWLLNFGYQITTEEITHFIPLYGNLTEKIHPMENRILQKERAFILGIEGIESLDEVHQFIAKCRRKQGLTINIHIETLRKSLESFPESYHIFTARLYEKLIAAVVTVVVDEKVVYYFLPATDYQFKSLSPMVHLISYIFTYYQQQEYKLIDFGISSQNGVPQDGLIQFKERMGGIKSSRFTFQKELIAL